MSIVKGDSFARLNGTDMEVRGINLESTDVHWPVRRGSPDGNTVIDRLAEGGIDPFIGVRVIPNEIFSGVGINGPFAEMTEVMKTFW